MYWIKRRRRWLACTAAQAASLPPPWTDGLWLQLAVLVAAVAVSMALRPRER